MTRERTSEETRYQIEEALTQQFLQLYAVEEMKMQQIVSIYKQEKPKINWKLIDEKIGRIGYNKMPFSYKHFHDVIMVAYQEQWNDNDTEFLDEVIIQILENSQEMLAEIQNYDDYNMFRKAVMNMVEEKLQFKQKNKPYKVIQDRMRTRINIMCMKTYNVASEFIVLQQQPKKQKQTHQKKKAQPKNQLETKMEQCMHTSIIQQNSTLSSIIQYQEDSDYPVIDFFDLEVDDMFM